MTESPDHVTCQEVVELVTAYLERALPAGDTALFEQHLNFCEGCVWYVEQMRGTVEAAGGVAEDDIPPDARDRLLAAFRGWSAP
jgi:anti-sigma factor RsiW